MSRPLESFGLLNRDWGVRLLESNSPRSVFIMLLLDVFMLGTLSAMILYDAVHFHRFNWTSGILFVAFVLPAFRYSRLIHRQLGR